jgi:hypothetical protein
MSTSAVLNIDIENIIDRNKVGVVAVSLKSRLAAQ